MEQPKITAILPCYNHGKYLGERIRSILAQTLPVSQIIFLDDASTDNSMQLARQLLEDTSIDTEFHSNYTNSGIPGKQWNKGVRLAKHDYIWIAETDDSCNSHFLEELLSDITEANAVIGFARSMLIGEDAHDIQPLLTAAEHKHSRADLPSVAMEGWAFSTRYLSTFNPIQNASAVVFRRDAYIRSGMANESMQYCSDWDCWIRLCRQGRVVCTPKMLNFFRCHPQTTRAKGYLPQVAAEFLGCRLQASLGISHTICYLEGHNSYNTRKIDAWQLLRRPHPQSQPTLTIALRSFQQHTAKSIRLHYEQLQNVPTFSARAWQALEWLEPAKSVWLTLFQLSRSVKSLATRKNNRSRHTSLLASSAPWSGVTREEQPRRSRG